MMEKLLSIKLLAKKGPPKGVVAFNWLERCRCIYLSTSDAADTIHFYEANAGPDIDIPAGS